MSVSSKNSKVINNIKVIEDSFYELLPSWTKLKDSFVPPILSFESNNNLSLKIDFTSKIVVVPETIFTQFEPEIIKFSGWVFLLQLFLAPALSIDISFSFVFSNFDNSTKAEQWLTIWKHSILDNESYHNVTNLFNIIPWSFEKNSSVTMNTLLDLVKLALNANLNLNATIINNHIHASIIRLIDFPKLSVMETLQLVMLHQTDNASFLIKNLDSHSKVHSTITRHLKKLYDDALLLKRFIPVFDLCGFDNIHILIDHATNLVQSVPDDNPWFFSLVQGYGLGLLQYYQFLTPNQSEVRSEWKKLANHFNFDSHIHFFHRIKESEFLFSNKLWSDSKSSWNLERDILSNIADQFGPDFLSDGSLELSGRKLSDEPIILDRDDYLLLNAIIKSRSVSLTDLTKIIDIQNIRKTTEKISHFFESKKLTEAFYPSFVLVPERLVLFIQTDLAPYDSFHDFLSCLPYVKIDTCLDLANHSLYRIVSIYTPIGYCDDVLNIIISKFKFTSIKILRPFDNIGSNWLFPVNYVNEKNFWDYNWSLLSQMVYNLNQ